MSEPSRIFSAERFSDLPRLPRDGGGPVFAEPRQAQAFALAVKLSEQGHFTLLVGGVSTALSVFWGYLFIERFF